MGKFDSSYLIFSCYYCWIYFKKVVSSAKINGHCVYGFNFYSIRFIHINGAYKAKCFGLDELEKRLPY